MAQWEKQILGSHRDLDLNPASIAYKLHTTVYKLSYVTSNKQLNISEP